MPHEQHGSNIISQPFDRFEIGTGISFVEIIGKEYFLVKPGNFGPEKGWREIPSWVFVNKEGSF